MKVGMPAHPYGNTIKASSLLSMFDSFLIKKISLPCIHFSTMCNWHLGFRSWVMMSVLFPSHSRHFPRTSILWQGCLCRCHRHLSQPFCQNSRISLKCRHMMLWFTVHLWSDPVERVAAVLSRVSRVLLSVADAEGGGEGHAEAAAHHRGPRVLRRLQPEALRHLQVLPKGAVSSPLMGALVRVVMFLSDVSVRVALVVLLCACCQAALKWTRKDWSKTALHLIYLALAFVYRKLLQPEALVFFLTDLLLSWSLSINW